MKPGALQFSFLASIVIHAVTFGVVVVVGGWQRAPPVAAGTPPPVLTIIAEPVEDFDPPSAAVFEAETVPLPTPGPPQRVVEQLVATPRLPEPLVQPEPSEPLLVALPVPDNPPLSQESKSPVVSLPAGLTVARPTAVVVRANPTQEGAAPALRGRAHPNYRKNAEPAYPPRARRLGLEGLVLLEVKVNLQGRAVSVTIKQSCGHEILDSAALKAVREWEFEPARLGEIPLESQLEVPVRFQLIR